MTINKSTFFGLVILLFFFPLFAKAQSPVNPGNTTPPASSAQQTTGVSATIPNPTGATTLMALITDILEKIVMPIAAVGVVVWIIWAGFQFVLAQGNPTEIGKAKQNLLWSLVGAGILLGAVAISKVLTSTIDVLIKP